MSADDTKEKEFVPFHEVAIKLLKEVINGELNSIPELQSIYYFYGPGMVRVPKEACIELIKLMESIAKITNISLRGEEAYSNLRSQIEG